MKVEKIQSVHPAHNKKKDDSKNKSFKEFLSKEKQKGGDTYGK